MEIVIEYVFLENFLICLLVLKSVAFLSKEKGSLFWLSGIFSGLITVCLPLLKLSTVGAFMFQMGLAFIYICISFKFKSLKKFIQLLICYFFVNLIYGGACFFFEQLVGITSLLVVLMVVLTTYFMFKFLMKRLNLKRQINNFCYDVEIENAGQRKQFRAFLDSGNLLFDPLTNSPVTLINFKVFSSLYSNITLEDLLRKSGNLEKLKLGHYISMGTLASDSKIFVFQADKLCVGDKVMEKPILGLSLTNFNQAFGTDIILNNKFAEL